MSLISSTFVIAVHDEILVQTGVGRAGCHIDKLESVLNRIDQQMYYSGVDDIFEIAAWFGIAISKGHAFVDGNKRTGLAVMLTYLEIQGITILEQTGLDDLMVDIVESQESHDTLSKLVAEFLYDLSVI
ncbi:TPA: type II toxin-antitoxin system death-on-curing family toxin [Acinetobacter baumannii]|jgi:death-on-curing protein|uniref:Death-on-curing protein n=1 Tax=Acinetobacter variabilis TaxID=70346 RepID=A0A7I8HR26_9GAMM|nr:MULTISPECIES: type II toxin-antitoxin system death-on-curing family toxin [Acinetobacter]ELB2471814.1 type II toxin-antitoxin system death-on-curing family toxin [Acinetobacter baumannii]KWR92280.1 death-on-curing protein [Acinetobacter baumannii]KWR92416.1 death-on-curing protein [Acinetobacter baumannii]MCE6005776.1 type II toxin-antitoxin system death-on-curing family toxin [Acinetobacter junii]MCM1639920.1 type II toxin-antitoxin system death-on-curing family toxin [Acinetobacter bauman